MTSMRIEKLFFLTLEVVSSVPKGQVVTISPLYTHPTCKQKKKNMKTKDKKEKNRKKNKE